MNDSIATIRKEIDKILETLENPNNDFMGFHDSLTRQANIMIMALHTFDELLDFTDWPYQGPKPPAPDPYNGPETRRMEDET